MYLLAAIVLEGAFRKWLLPSSLQWLAFGAKDLIVLAYIFSHRAISPLLGISSMKTMGLVVGILLLPAMLIGSGGVWVSALITYKNAVLWPIFAASFASSLTMRSVARYRRPFALMTLAIGVLSVIQFSSPASSSLNRYAWDESIAVMGVSQFGGEVDAVRATGTFSYIGGLSTFAIYSTLYFVWQIICFRKTSGLAWTYIGAIGGVVCGLCSGSRSVVVVLGIVLVFVVASVGSLKLLGQITIFALILLTVLALVSQGQIVDAFVSRWISAEDTTMGRITKEGLSADYLALLTASPFGIGLGQMSGYAVTQSGQLPTFDDGGSMAVLEGGVLGLVALWGMGLFLISIVISVTFGGGKAAKASASLLALFPVFTLSQGSWYDHNGTAFAWVSIAVWLSYIKGNSLYTKRARPVKVEADQGHLVSGYR